jgi:hypothetical protein
LVILGRVDGEMAMLLAVLSDDAYVAFGDEE